MDRVWISDPPTDMRMGIKVEYPIGMEMRIDIINEDGDGEYGIQPIAIPIRHLAPKLLEEMEHNQPTHQQRLPPLSTYMRYHKP